MESESNDYIGVLEGFASDFGSTLDDLTLHFEDDYESRNNRGESFLSNVSGASWPEMEGFAHGARPLTFTNPVYFMFNGEHQETKVQKMTLIPLSQFDVNNDRDKIPNKKRHKKHRKESFMHSIAGFLHKGQRKQSSDMIVTAPAVSVETADRRHSDMAPRPDQQPQQIEESHNRSASLETSSALKNAKKPPTKSPRSSRIISRSEVTKEEVEVTKNLMDKPEITSPPPTTKTESPVMPKSDSVSDLADLDVDDENVKTISEVMREYDGDDVTKEEPDKTIATELPDNGTMKRNKTVKWAGSRAAPTLIREFTKKNKKYLAADFKTPPSSANTTPIKRVSTDDVIKGVSDVISTSDDVIPISESPSQVDLLAKVAVDAENKTKDKRTDSSSFTMLSLCLPPAPKLKRTSSAKVRLYLNKMGSSEQYALGYAVSEFVRQTLKYKEHRPLVLLHNIRSFLSDIKRYLLTNPHVGLMKKIQKILKDVSKIDVDGAVDDTLDRLVLYPLHNHIYKTLVVDYTVTKQLDRIKEALEIAKTKSPKELGIRETLVPPSDEHMVEISSHFKALQGTYSPYYKLKDLLAAVTSIYMHTKDHTTEDGSARNIGADDFLPLLVYSIVKCEFIAADIEAQFIDGLLDPVLLLGEGGYYLTTLFSAVQVLSSMKRKEPPVPHISDLQSFLKVGIAATDKLISPKLTEVPHHKTLHVPPSMTARSLCAMIARKYEVSEPSLYCLHVVVKGDAHELKPNEFPQLVKMDLLCQFPPNTFYFVYQRKDDIPTKVSGSQEDVFIANDDEKPNGAPSSEQPLPPPISQEESIMMETEENAYEFATEYRPTFRREYENVIITSKPNDNDGINETVVDHKEETNVKHEEDIASRSVLKEDVYHETEELLVEDEGGNVDIEDGQRNMQTAVSQEEIDAAIDEINIAVETPATEEVKLPISDQNELEDVVVVDETEVVEDKKLTEVEEEQADGAEVQKYETLTTVVKEENIVSDVEEEETYVEQYENMEEEKYDSSESLDDLEKTIDNDVTLTGIEIEAVVGSTDEDLKLTDVGANEEEIETQVSKPERPQNLITSTSPPHVDTDVITPIPIEELPSPPPIMDIDTLPSPPTPNQLNMTQSWDTGLDNTSHEKPAKLTTGRKVTRHSSVSNRSEVPSTTPTTFDPSKCNTLPKGRDPSELTVSTLRKYFESQSNATDE